MQIRDRIKEFRRVKASELIANDRNPRRHPDHQSEAVSALLREVGYADALIARETEDGLVLIDGHLRQKLTPDQMVPVLVLDVTEDESNKLLLSLDPLAALADYDREQLDSLLRDVTTGEAALAEMLAGLAEEQGGQVETNNNVINHFQQFKEQYLIIIECQSEMEQSVLLDRYIKEGIRCRALIS